MAGVTISDQRVEVQPRRVMGPPDAVEGVEAERLSEDREIAASREMRLSEEVLGEGRGGGVRGGERRESERWFKEVPLGRALSYR